MKKLLLSLCAVFAFSYAEAQYYLLPHPNANANPGTLNNDGEYPLNTAGAQTGWTVIHDATNNSIVWTPVINLPGSFNFKFNNVPVTAYKVSTSGVMTFTTSAVAVPTTAHTALPSAAIPDKSLCTWGMVPQAADKIAYKMFGAAPNRQYWMQFNSYTTPGTNPTGWTYWSIVLEEGTNKIYFVDQKTANGTIGLTVGIQIDAATAFQLPASPNVGALAGNGGTPSDNSYYEFAYGTQPNYDLEMKSLGTPSQVALSKAPFTLTGAVKNSGVLPVTSFNLTYKVDNNAPVTTSVTGVNIATQTAYKYSHPIAWSPTANGTYAIKIWTSNINGNPDQVPSNDTIFKTIQVMQSPRIVLHEVFTSSTCPPCLAGNANLHAITKANPGVSIDIKYQQTYPSNPLGTGPDPYSTLEGRNRHTIYYGINSIPRMEVNGGWNQNAQSYTSGLLSTFQANPANMILDGQYSVNGNTVTANAIIIPFANVPSNNLVAHMVITERHTVNNARSNGETDFYNVMKKMMPNENGQPIAALVANQPISLLQSYTFPAGNTVEHFDSLEVVFFVQDKITKEVFNAGYATKTAQVTGVAADQEKATFSVFPNPANGVVNVSFVPEKGKTATLEIMNMLGEKIYTKTITNLTGQTQQLSADLSGQASGIYFVNLAIDGKKITRKISLVN